ncbi:unnamed protein product [Lymnaea stagnalis]|uniref:Spt20-like SEP domain-containing protein n=1 Tax=Lymnaea stagnalis TaxID=6523 RepID=A0AAV2I5J8_LYMST
MELPHFPDIERAIEYAEYVLACSDQSPATFVKSSTGSSNKSKSIHQKLLDLYIEETMKEPENKDLVCATHLLAKLCKRERLNCMVLSLYPGNEGYSIMLRSKSGVESETMKLPYEESEILEYVDAAQLPPFLLDLLEKAQMNVFYSGCVIVEVRDYRRSATGSHDTQYVLLRPSPQSLLRDITAMSCDGHPWTQDDLLHLESELILATEEPLCLDPSPAVMFVENAIQYEEKFLNDPALRRSIKKNTQAAVNRKRKLGQAPAPKGMQLFDFLAKKKEKGKPVASTGLSKARLLVDSFKEKPQQKLTVPESIDVKKFVKLPDPPPADGVIFVEEHTMERDPTLERHMMAKISIFQPQLGDNYFGEFYLDHDYTQGRTGEEGRRCRFVIGSRQCVDRYLQQFKDLFTEEGKLQVKIAIVKANETTPTIHYTQVMPQATAIQNLTPTAITINNAQTLIKQVAASQQLVKASDMGTVANLAAKRNIPIQLSLSLSPAVSLSTSQGIFAQASAGGIPSSLSAQFIASTVPSGTISMTAQRIKATTNSSQQRPNSSPLASPATTPKVSTPQQPHLPTSASIMAIPKAPTPTPAQTPPPNARTPTPTLAGSRRASGTEQQMTSLGQQQVQQQSLANFLQGLTSGTGQSNTGDGQQQQQQQSGITNISIGNLSNLPSNINIQNLGIPGVNIPGLQQVSLAQIAVPITMINNNPSILQAQSGLLGTASTTSGSNTATFVTMVTALQASTSNTSTSTSMSMSSQIPSSSGRIVCSGMLSFPMGLSGLTQLMPVTSKTQGGQTIRGSTMPLLQLQGQQGQIQLVSLQQQRGQVKPGTLTTGQHGVTRLTQGTTSSVPLSSVLTSQQMTALGVGGKAGQGGGATITAQQLIQLAGGASASLGQGTSQLATHVTFQKGQGGGSQTLQFHPLPLKPTGTTTIAQAQSTSKSKSKKRTTPTPPTK